MPIKDYFKFFTSLWGGDKIDCIVVFKTKRPNIRQYDELRKLGTWTSYSDNGYRLFCKFKIEKLKTLISTQTGISEKDIEVIRPSDNYFI